MRRRMGVKTSVGMMLMAVSLQLASVVFLLSLSGLAMMAKRCLAVWMMLKMRQFQQRCKVRFDRL